MIDVGRVEVSAAIVKVHNLFKSSEVSIMKVRAAQPDVPQTGSEELADVVRVGVSECNVVQSPTRMRQFSEAYGWAKHLAFKGLAVWQHHGAADWIGEDLCRSTIPEQRIRIPGVDVRSRFASRDLFAKAVDS